uniref:Uncharacterized protein n=1 Tax=Helianthus annuus TaxID=4232 RepID=A0A251TL25_HELAN
MFFVSDINFAIYIDDSSCLITYFVCTDFSVVPYYYSILIFPCYSSSFYINQI